MTSAMTDRIVERDGVRLVVEEAGDGVPVVLLHGLTATRRYVVMGSRSLERGGHRVISYDARAHGQSSPAPTPEAYGYDALASDLRAVMDACGVERAVLAGASMGAHTLLRFALDAPERVAGVVVVTPAFDPEALRDFARWDALAEGLRRAVYNFMHGVGLDTDPRAWFDTPARRVRGRRGLRLPPVSVPPDLIRRALHESS